MKRISRNAMLLVALHSLYALWTIHILRLHFSINNAVDEIDLCGKYHFQPGNVAKLAPTFF